jgi:hypothetical protein
VRYIEEPGQALADRESLTGGLRAITSEKSGILGLRDCSPLRMEVVGEPEIARGLSESQFISAIFDDGAEPLSLRGFEYGGLRSKSPPPFC